MNAQELLKSIMGEDAHILSPLVGGMMNESYIVSKNDKKYVLYISTAQANEMVDRKREKKDQKIFFDLGLTSRNVYFDSDKGIKINEYIKGSSIDKVETFDYHKIAHLMQVLHGSNKLCEVDYAPFERFMGYEKEANSFVEHQADEYLVLRNALFVNKEYLQNQKKVICHNDAQRSNIVVTPEGDYYFIDFEFVGNNDPVYDIACFANGTVKEGYQLLQATYPELTLDLKKRFYLWRIYISLQWYEVAIVKHYRGEGKIHNFNFLDIANHFLVNAQESYQEYLKIK